MALHSVRHLFAHPSNVCARACADILLTLAFCAIAGAQSGAGSIQGTVTDSAGAAIPGASIHVTNQATGVSSDTKTNKVGFYQVPDLFTGTYTVAISAPAMEANQRVVELQVNQNMEINAALTPGVVTQTVVVTADTFQLTTTDSGTLASTLDNARLNQLPMNGRSLLTLTQMSTPGLETAPQSAAGGSANGLPGPAMEYVVDGVSLADREFGGEHTSQAQMPDPDAIQEVRVETTGIGTQYATPAAGIITTKSGTNKLRGTLFETARNNAIGIAKSRSNPANYVAPEYIRNEFGGSIGGPIVIPHIYEGKNKSFWFFSFERYSLAQVTDTNISVPSTQMRNGDWSGLTNSSGTPQQLYNPATTTSATSCNGGAANPYCRAPFTNNQIPLSLLAPTTKILYQMLPGPTTNSNPAVIPNFNSPVPSYNVVPTVTFRLDHNLNENNKMYLRYTSNLQTNITPRITSVMPESLAVGSIPTGALGFSSARDVIFATALGYAHTFSPTFFAETVASAQWYAAGHNSGGQPNLNYEKVLGLPNNFGEPGFPTIGSGSFTPFNYGTQFNYDEDQMMYDLDENLTKIAGHHQFQFGGRFRHERIGYLPDRSSDSVSYGAYATALENPSSGTNYTATANTGMRTRICFWARPRLTA